MPAAGLLLACALLMGDLGPHQAPLTAIGVTGGLLARALLLPGGRWARLIVLAAGLPVLFRVESIEGRLAILAIIVSAAPAPSRRVDAAFAAAALSWRLLLVLVPPAWMIFVESSRLLSEIVGLVTGQALDLGPSASGLDLWVLFLLQRLAGRIEGRPPSVRPIAASLGILSAYVAVLPALARLPGNLPALSALFTQAGEHSGASLATAAFFAKNWLLAALCLLPARSNSASAGPSRRHGWALASGGACCAILATGLASIEVEGARRHSHGMDPGEVLVVARPGVDFDPPGGGRRGLANAGMFGVLPRYIALTGRQVALIDESLPAQRLRGAGLLIVPFPSAALAERHDDRLESWMREGGTLVLVGDHTDVMEVRDPVNALAGPHGMRLRFDSAYPAIREWHGCMDGPAARRRSAAGWGTGASIELRPPARPLLISRYALSDRGDRANGGAGGFLGDYAWGGGERLGDLVVAAWAPVGRGRLIVLGDSSPLQTLGLPRAHAWLTPLLADPADPRPERETWRGLLLAGAALALSALGIAGLPGACFMLAVPVAAGALFAPPACRAEVPDRAPVGVRIARVDLGHAGVLTADLWHEHSIGGLLLNLMRRDLLPIVHPSESHPVPWRPEDLIVLPAPRTAPASGERDAIRSHLAAGGEVLVSASAVDRAAVAWLLDPLGARLHEWPLGPVPVRAGLSRQELEVARREPQFRRAWPVRFRGGAPARVRYEAFGEAVVAELDAEGGGRVIVIADGDFLGDGVLENEHDAWEGNVSLLSEILAPGRGRAEEGR